MPDLPPDPSSTSPTALSPETPFARLVASRRTVHRFDAARPVPVQAVRRAAALATHAPNHKRTEPWTFVLLGPVARQAAIDRAVGRFRERLGEDAADVRRARWEAVPDYLVVLCRRTPGDARREREDYAAVAAATHTLTLALWEEGIGSKWTTGPVTHGDDLLGLVGATADEAFVAGLLMLGYPADEPAPRVRTRTDVFRVTA